MVADGAIVSFYFDARMQVTGQGFEREMIEVLARIEAPKLPLAAPGAPAPPLHVAPGGAERNAALEDWQRTQA